MGLTALKTWTCFKSGGRGAETLKLEVTLIRFRVSAALRDRVIVLPYPRAHKELAIET